MRTIGAVMAHESSSNITLVSFVYGSEYFDKWAQPFFEALKQQDCRNAILISDRHVEVPSFIDLIVQPFNSMGEALNLGCARVETDWLIPLGFDDLLLDGALEPINSTADVYGFPLQLSGLRSGLMNYLGGYDHMSTLQHNPMACGTAMRRELMQEIPFRDAIYCDWIHHCETSFFGKTFEYSHVPRVNMVRHDQALSVNAVPEAHKQVYEFQERLHSGAILKGVPHGTS